MSNRHHLPAGQTTQGGGPGGPGVDMAGGVMGGGGPRRRQPPQQHQHQHQQHHQHQPPQYGPPYPQQMGQQHMGPQHMGQQHMGQQHMAQHMGQHMSPPIYPGYVPYAPQQYYGMPPQYQGGAVPSPGYLPYQSFPRSPPSMHQYVPMVGVSVPPNYPRPSAPPSQSPGLSTPYQPPPVQAAPPSMPPQTPSSTHSSQMLPPPSPPTPQTREPQAVMVPAQEPPAVLTREPFRPPLPWLSRPDVDFPAKAVRPRRRRKLLTADSAAVSLPIEQHVAAAGHKDQGTQAGAASTSSNTSVPPSHQARSETPSTQDQPSEDATSTSPTTPSSLQRSRGDAAASVTPTKSSGASTRALHPAMPLMPAVPRPTAKPAGAEKPQSESKPTDDGSESTTKVAAPADDAATGTESEADTAALVDSAPPRVPPTSWANLFAKPSTAAHAGSGMNGSHAAAAGLDGNSSAADVDAANMASAFSSDHASSLAEAIRAYQVGGGDKVSFIEPRGLINTGNMCYMNSVLQVLMFCVPFYDFLGQVGLKAAHSFKSDTPLIDAMIMFMHEYKVLKSAPSAEQLRRTLKSEDLERYGEPFTPEFVYEAIRQLSRFASMRRGHQQDAEEFLGFLLQSLDDECTLTMGAPLLSPGEVGLSHKDSADPTGDWLEVGRKQRAAVTRSSGSNSSTPINKIFGGLLRSEFRVPGLKDSITTEPYQPLQLDIGAPDVRNVVDALRGLTRPERLQGDFNSPRGKDVMATKQVSIETLPPVLILHLKRFQFDAEGHGTVKIWKKVGYPLELEIPREALSRQTRQTMGDGAMPRYRLISVVYHHGKNASGGHYTVDVRRQDGQEWIRLDDTVLRRVRSEDIAEGGSEEDAKDVRQREARKETSSVATGAAGNRFGAMNDEDTGDEDGWKEVTASAGNHKRWSSVVNGTGNGATKGKPAKDNIKDNKVAYLLFYQRM